MSSEQAGQTAQPTHFTGSHKERMEKVKALSLRFSDLLEASPEQFTGADIAMCAFSVAAAANMTAITPLQEAMLKSPAIRQLGREFAAPIAANGAVGIIGLCFGMLDALRAHAAEIDAEQGEVATPAGAEEKKEADRAETIDQLLAKLSALATGGHPIPTA